MGRIPDQTIREIRDRVDIVDLVGRYVNLRRAGGQSHKGLCPFHDEKTPSFNVHAERQMFHCFGCGEGGDAIAFLMKHESLTFPEAARILARECGMEIPEDDGAPAGRTERLLEALDIAQGVYRAALESDEGRGAREYLDRRGLDGERIARFGLGYAPDRWDSVATALEKHGIPAEVGEEAGLCVPRKSGRGHYDRLRGRLVFPIADARGRIVAFGGRALQADQEPKYLNTSESPLFRKREAFYGLPHALEPLRRRERAVLCEGYFDRLALDRAGVGEGLATCGTALTAEHAIQLRRRTKQVVLLFDGDEAGRKAACRALELLLPEGLRVRAAALPPGQDPDDFLKAEGENALQDLVEKAPDGLEMEMKAALARGCATPVEKAEAVGHIAPLVALVRDPVERAEYARRLAVAAAADPRAVEVVVRSAARGGDAGRSARDVLELEAPIRSSNEERHLRQLVAQLLHTPSLVDDAMVRRIEAGVPSGSWKAVLLEICRAAGEAGDELDVFAIAERLDEESGARLRQAVVEGATASSEVPADRVLDDLLQWFERRDRSERGRELTRRLSESGDAAALLAEKQREIEARGAAQRAARSASSGTTP